MAHAPSTKMEFLTLNKTQMSQWDVQKVMTPVRCLISPPIGFCGSVHDGREVAPSPITRMDRSPQGVNSMPGLLENSLLMGTQMASPGRQVSYGMNSLGIDRGDGNLSFKHFMSIQPYTSDLSGSEMRDSLQDSAITIASVPVTARSVSLGLQERDEPTFEYQCTIAQRFLDVSATPTSLGLSSTDYDRVYVQFSQHQHQLQLGAVRDYSFSPISDAMYVSNHDEQPYVPSVDNKALAAVADMFRDDSSILFQITPLPVDVAISTSGVSTPQNVLATPRPEADMFIDPFMFSVSADPTILDVNSASEFMDLLKMEQPYLSDMPLTGDVSAAPGTLRPGPFPPMESPTAGGRHHHHRHSSYTLMTPTHLYIPKQVKHRSLTIPAEFSLKKRIFHTRRMIRVIIGAHHRIGSALDNYHDPHSDMHDGGYAPSYPAGMGMHGDDGFEAYQVFSLKGQSNEIAKQDAFILYCGDRAPDDFGGGYGFGDHSVLSPLRMGHMSPLAPFTLNISSDISYRSIKFNRETIQSPIIKNSVLTATPRVVIVSDSAHNSQSKRFLVTPLHSATPYRDTPRSSRDPGSAKRPLNCHALSSNEPSNERAMGDGASDQSYDSIFIDMHKPKLSGNSAATPYAFSIECNKRDTKEIPLPPTLKKN